MKKQRFIVEITRPSFDKSLNADDVIEALDEGFDYPDWRIDVKEEKV